MAWFCLFCPPAGQSWSADSLRDLLAANSCGLSDYVRQALLQESDPDVFEPNNEAAFIATGLPRRPMYRELACRLERWANTKNATIMFDASALGLAEESTTCLPESPEGFNPQDWLEQAGDAGVLRILGLRQTIGTDPRMLLPPSRSKLLESANTRLNSKAALTVAARARAKHAMRSSELFYGTIKGNDKQQNADTALVIERILREAVWINIHTFGGMEGNPVLEARVEAGYGARWTADWSDPLRPTNIMFRGFLEPTMKDGHEKGWRH